MDPHTGELTFSNVFNWNSLERMVMKDIAANRFLRPVIRGVVLAYRFPSWFVWIATEQCWTTSLALLMCDVFFSWRRRSTKCFLEEWSISRSLLTQSAILLVWITPVCNSEFFHFLRTKLI